MLSGQQPCWAELAARVSQEQEMKVFLGNAVYFLHSFRTYLNRECLCDGAHALISNFRLVPNLTLQ